MYRNWTDEDHDRLVVIISMQNQLLFIVEQVAFQDESSSWWALVYCTENNTNNFFDTAAAASHHSTTTRSKRLLKTTHLHIFLVQVKATLTQAFTCTRGVNLTLHWQVQKGYNEGIQKMKTSYPQIYFWSHQISFFLFLLCNHYTTVFPARESFKMRFFIGREEKMVVFLYVNNMFW